MKARTNAVGSCSTRTWPRRLELHLRILLIGNYLLEDGTSMPRYAEMLRREMTARGHHVELLLPKVFFGRLRSGGTLGKWLSYVDKYLLFPFVLRKAKRAGWDVLHVCDQGNAMYLKPLGGTPTTPTITCHDLLAIRAAQGAYPGVKVSATGKMQQRWILLGLLGAARIVAVSEETALELGRLGCCGEITRIGQPLHNPFSPASPEEVIRVQEKAGAAMGRRYVLHVGGNAWYKNRTGTLRLFAALRRRQGFEDLMLLMAGGPWTDDMRRIVADEDLADAVMEVRRPSDSELRALYTGAQALLFPSLAEGFGWPVLEAQSCGCAVVTSNRAPMTEVAGEAAIFIDPEAPAAAARVVEERWGELPRLRELGFENTKRFGLEGMMNQYEEFFGGFPSGR